MPDTYIILSGVFIAFILMLFIILMLDPPRSIINEELPITTVTISQQYTATVIKEPQVIKPEVIKPKELKIKGTECLHCGNDTFTDSEEFLGTIYFKCSKCDKFSKHGSKFGGIVPKLN